MGEAVELRVGAGGRARLPLLAGDLLGFGAPAHGDESKVVQTVVHGDRVDVDHLETGGDASSVLLPVGGRGGINQY